MTDGSHTQAAHEVPTPAAPLFTIVGGDPTDEQIAAIFAVISAAAADEAPEFDVQLDPWSAPSTMHRTPMPPPGTGAWA